MELRNGTRQLDVPRELAREHPERHLRVGQGAVRALVLGLAVKTGSRREVAGLLRKEDALRVDEAPVRDRKRHLGAQELDAQHGEIKARDVVPPQIAALEKAPELHGHVLEGRGVPNVPIADAMDGRGRRRDRHSGVEPLHELLAAAVRMDLQAGDLDDPIRARVRPRRFRVEHDEGTVELQRLIDHRGILYPISCPGVWDQANPMTRTHDPMIR